MLASTLPATRVTCTFKCPGLVHFTLESVLFQAMMTEHPIGASRLKPGSTYGSTTTPGNDSLAKRISPNDNEDSSKISSFTPIYAMTIIVRWPPNTALVGDLARKKALKIHETGLLIHPTNTHGLLSGAILTFWKELKVSTLLLCCTAGFPILSTVSTSPCRALTNVPCKRYNAKENERCGRVCPMNLAINYGQDSNLSLVQQ